MTSSEGFQQHFSVISKPVCCGFYMKKNIAFTLISFPVCTEMKWLFISSTTISVTCSDSSNSSSITFWLVSSVIALEATEPVSELVTQMTVELIKIISFSKRDECKSYILFHVKATTNRFWNDAEMLLKSIWTSHLQMMNWLEPQF